MTEFKPGDAVWVKHFDVGWIASSVVEADETTVETTSLWCGPNDPKCVIKRNPALRGADRPTTGE